MKLLEEQRKYLYNGQKVYESFLGPRFPSVAKFNKGLDTQEKHDQKLKEERRKAAEERKKEELEKKQAEVKRLQEEIEKQKTA